MSYSSRHQSSRRTYADPSRAIYDDEDYVGRCLPSIRERLGDVAHSALSSHGSYRSHALHDAHSGYDSHVSSGNREPRNIRVMSHKITVTRYSVNDGGDSTTYHDSQEYTAYDGQYASSYSYTDHSSPLSNRDDDDLRYLSAGGHRNTTRRTRVEPRIPESNSHRSGTESKPSDRSTQDSSRTDAPKMGRHGQSARHSNAKHSRVEELKSTHTDTHSGKSQSDSSHKSANSDAPGQSKPGSGSSRRQEKPDSSRSESRRPEKSHRSRSENRRGENPRSTRDDRTHGDRQRSHHPEASPVEPTEKLPDHYAILQVGPCATHEQIKSAAKRRRIEVHPDRLKKPGMSESEVAKIDKEAAEVGQAAEVLSNPTLRQEYDRSVFVAKASTLRKE